MCLAIPGRILSIEGDDPAFRTAQVDFCGVQKTISLAYTPDVLPGEFVLAHVGFAVSTVAEDEAICIHESIQFCSEVIHAFSGS